MRDYLLLGAILGALPLCFYRPAVGILLWVWIGLMNPHRFTWGMAYDFPVAQVVAGVTLAGVFFAWLRKDVHRIPWDRETLLLIVLWLSFTLTTFFAVDEDVAWGKWSLFSKILLMSVVALFFFQDKTKLRSLLVVMVLSVGFFGVKGGIFGLVTAGQYVVLGPPESFIRDNNALALAELMVLPILFYLGKEERKWYFKYGWYTMATFTMLSVLLSYSRGALLSFIAMSLLLVLTSSRKFLAVPLSVLGLVLALNFIPDQWFDRMSTIKNYQEDPSARSRINGWIFAYRLALDYPLTGGGFGAFNRDMFFKYAPEPDDVFNGHSIYFQVLGEHGFLGLGIFVGLLCSGFLSLRKVKKVVDGFPDLLWAKDYAVMLQLGLTAYAVSGAFLPLAYFDLYYYFVVAGIMLKAIVRKELELRGDAFISQGEAEIVQGRGKLPSVKPFGTGDVVQPWRRR